MDFFAIHSFTRYFVLLAGALALLYGVFGMLSRRPFDTLGLTILRVFAIILDLQVVLGLLTLLTRAFYPALIGHLTMMLFAVAVAHLGAVRLKKAPAAERRFGTLFAASAISLLLVVGGILAIQRPVL